MTTLLPSLGILVALRNRTFSKTTDTSVYNLSLIHIQMCIRDRSPSTWRIIIDMSGTSGLQAESSSSMLFTFIVLEIFSKDKCAHTLTNSLRLSSCKTMILQVTLLHENKPLRYIYLVFNTCIEQINSLYIVRVYRICKTFVRRSFKNCEYHLSFCL